MRKDPLGEKLFLDKFHEVTEVIRTVHVQAGDSHSASKSTSITPIPRPRSLPATSSNIRCPTLRQK